MAGALSNTGFREYDPTDETDPSNYGDVINDDSGYDSSDDSTAQDTVDSSNAQDQQQPTSGVGALSAAQRARMSSEASQLNKEAGAGEASALAKQQERANAIRDALRSSRMKLVSEHPDKQAMWMAVAAALGSPTRGFGIGASMAQGAEAAVPFLQQQAQDKTAREGQISKYDEALAQYGQGPNAISSDVLNSQMKLSELKRRQAQALEIAAAKYSGSGAGASTALGKLIAERDALGPNDPNRKLYDRQIALLQKTAGGAATADAVVGDISKSGDEYLATIPADMRDTVKALSEGRQPLPTGFALKQPHWIQVMGALGHYDPGFDFADAGARVKTRASFASGPDSDNIKNIGTAIHHLHKLKADYAALNNTRFSSVNWVENAVLPALGGQQTQKNVAAVETDAKAVAHELAGVFRKTGMSEAEIKDWQDSITTSATPATSDSIINSALDLMDGRLYEVGQKYNRGMGTTKDPMELLSPEDRKLYVQLHGGQSPPEPLSVPGKGEKAGAAPQSFKSVAEAEAAGFKAGDRVTINGVSGYLR